jgi:hypothetical protein
VTADPVATEIDGRAAWVTEDEDCSLEQAAFIDLPDGRVVAIRASGDLSEVSRDRQRATFDAVLDSIEFTP